MKRFKEFDIETFDYEKHRDGTTTFKVFVDQAPLEEMRAAEAVEVTLPVDFWVTVEKLQHGDLSRDAIKQLGEKLDEILFPGTVGEIFETNWKQILSEENAGLRIRLKVDNYALAQLPWEFSYSRIIDEFLALDQTISLVRTVRLKEQDLIQFDHDSQDAIRVLLVSANPKGHEYVDLKLEDEMSAIADIVNEIKGVETDPYPDATRDRLLDALQSGAAVFHFSGHGEFDEKRFGQVYGTFEGEGQIILLKGNQRPDPVSTDTLGIQLANRGIQLVVLNACEGGKHDLVKPWAGVAPGLIRKRIPAVVGMQYKIQNRSAKHFSKGFYGALARGLSVDEAVTEGRRAIHWYGEEADPDWGVPVLYLHPRAGNAVLFPTGHQGVPYAFERELEHRANFEVDKQMRGEDVHALQVRLWELGYADILRLINSRYTVDTARAVYAFTNNSPNLSSSRIVTAEVWKMLFSTNACQGTGHLTALKPDDYAVLPEPLVYDDKQFMDDRRLDGEFVRLAQAYLWELGYDKQLRWIDGIFGPRTELAINDWHMHHNRARTSRLDQSQWKELLAEWTELNAHRRRPGKRCL